MSFSDELQELKGNSNHISFSDSIYAKREEYLNTILEKCRKAASNGQQSCEGVFRFARKDDRRCIFEYLRYELNNQSKYGFRNVQIKEHDSTLEADFYVIKYFISWLKKDASVKKEDYTERTNRPLKDLESIIENNENNRAYKKERKKQFLAMHPNWKWLKPLLITLAIIIIMIILW